MESRYFVESSVFNAAFVGVLILIISRFKASWLQFVVLLMSAGLLVVNIFRLSDLEQSFSHSYPVNNLSTVECLQLAPKITSVVVEQCGIPNEYGWWQRHRKSSNIFLLDSYSAGLDAVLNPGNR